MMLAENELTLFSASRVAVGTILATCPAGTLLPWPDTVRYD